MPLLYERLPPKFFQILDPRIKFFLFLVNLSLVLLSSKPGFQLACLALNVLALKIFNLSWKNLFKLWMEPLIIALVLLFLKSFTFFPPNFSPEGFKEGILLVVRVLSAVSVVSFFLFTTTVSEILQVLSWCRVSKLFLEVLLLTYRFVFLLFDEVQVAFIAQKNRLGYTSFKNTLNSLKLLGVVTFLRIYQHSEEILQSMEQRGYEFKNLIYHNFRLKIQDLIYLGSGTLLLFILWKVL
ncbi:MAG: cobalt ECF transporter T component CbiQ [Thermodesulfobacteriaceae bacterium]|nr:cobalt ECF transporter T component CbiQ [Caldimicrobium sp.]MCX8041504.1 cobalt ECF transporter T component CbiQ [Thermodesulfobacteriaceae bacterium]MDW8135476.1 cobalt ECF transporter T component CbiQ [Thermodesulfobacterium sp.]